MKDLNENTDDAGREEPAVGHDCLIILQKSVKTLREMKDVQCRDGTWNYDPYMHGMANGIIFALSMFDDKPPQYLDAPDVWLKDIPNDDKPIVASAT